MIINSSNVRIVIDDNKVTGEISAKIILQHHCKKEIIVEFLLSHNNRYYVSQEAKNNISDIKEILDLFDNVHIVKMKHIDDIIMEVECKVKKIELCFMMGEAARGILTLEYV